MTYREAVKMIKADGIYSAEVIEALKEAYNVGWTDGAKAAKVHLEMCQEENDCEDCISRQAVLDKLNDWEWQELYLPIHFKENIIDVLPSVMPVYHCDRCGKKIDHYGLCDECDKWLEEHCGGDNE